MFKNIAKFAVMASLLVCMAAFVGCAKNDGLCSVEGTVTLDGAPIESGNINFGPEVGQPGTATGGKIENGKYSIRASEGNMIVSIRAQKKETVQDPEHGEVINMIDLVPEKYNRQSELKATVNAGKNKIDFDLQSK